MSDTLYQAEILALAKQGRTIGRLENATVSARVDNPICGDRVILDFAIEDGRIAAIGAKVQGCALCQAATAMIAEEALGSDTQALEAVRAAVADYLSGVLKDEALPWGRLASFGPVRDARSRHDCVLLPFKAASKALAARETVG